MKTTRSILLVSVAYICLASCGGDKPKPPPTPPVVTDPVPQPAPPLTQDAGEPIAPILNFRSETMQDFIEVFREKNILRAKLDVTRSKPYNKTVLQSVCVKNVKRGDFLDIMGEVQVTSEHGYNVMFSGQILVDEFADTPTGKGANRSNGQNFNREEHHLNETRVGIYEVKADAPELYVKLICWSASTRATVGAKLSVDDADLIVKRLRNPSVNTV